MASAVVAVILLALLCCIQGASFYYVLLPRFVVTINTSISVLSPTSLVSAFIEHLNQNAANFTNTFQELELAATVEPSSNVSSSSGFVFSGHAVFDSASVAAPFDSNDLYSNVVEPAFFSSAGSAALDKLLETISLSVDNLQITLQDESTLTNPAFYYVPLPPFQVALKHHNPVHLQNMDDTLEEELEAHLLDVFHNTSKSVGDDLFDVHLEGKLHDEPFDANNSLYFANYTGSAVFIDNALALDYTKNSVFENMIPLALLSQYGYSMLVERLNNTDAWNGLLGLRITVDNPRYDPNPASQGSMHLLSRPVAVFVFGIALLVGL